MLLRGGLLALAVIAAAAVAVLAAASPFDAAAALPRPVGAPLGFVGGAGGGQRHVDFDERDAAAAV